MHDGNDPDRIQRADRWLQTHLSRYVQWAESHNRLLIVTWDEDDGKSDNHIPMILVGPMVRRGRFDERIDHYGLVRTITEMYGAPSIGLSRQSRPLSTIWNTQACFRPLARSLHTSPPPAPYAFHNSMTTKGKRPQPAISHHSSARSGTTLKISCPQGLQNPRLQQG